MSPLDALSILDQATQPGARLTRGDYIHVDAALAELKKLVDSQSSQSLPAERTNA